MNGKSAPILGLRLPPAVVLPEPDGRVLRLSQIVAWLVAALAAVACIAGDFCITHFVAADAQPWLRAGLFVAVSALATWGAIRVNLPLLREKLQSERDARLALERAARLEGALLAAQTMEHHLNNDLAITVGYSEMLARNPMLDEASRGQADEAHRGAVRAAQHLSALLSVTEVEEDHDLGARLIDLRGRQAKRVAEQ